MECDHFNRGRCRSCSLLEIGYPDQLATKHAHVTELLPEPQWLPPVPSPQQGFRNKAKMVVGGTLTDPTLGILDADLAGVDLIDCALHSPGLVAALPVLREFITRAALTPYDVRARRGELKLVLATESADGELMVRWVLRSTEALSRVRKHLAWLHQQLPAARVVSINVQPEPKAVLEGETEIVLTDQATLPMRIGPTTLQLRPQSFFQTNTAVATELYQQSARWLAAAAPDSVWDLYCGVGGFAWHAVEGARRVTGVELSPEAIAAARSGRTERAGRAPDFLAGDATTYPVAAGPDLVIVNPPRRGIGPLAQWLASSTVPRVIYSSCNPASLQRDLAAMPMLRPVRGRVFDMFPHTPHCEVLVELIRA